jgi:hypothetical protein
MSNLTVKGNASGTGTTTLESPNTNTSSTVTLPDATTTLVGTADFASQAQAEAGTNNTTLMTPLRTEEHTLFNDLGWSQSWQDVSGSRAVSTSYQNLTTRPIQVAIRISSGTDRPIEVSVNNSTWVQVGTSYSTWWPFTYVVVPVGHYYRVNGSATILNWAELR